MKYQTTVLPIGNTDVAPQLMDDEQVGGAHTADRVLPVQRVAQELGVYAVFPSYERGAERGVVYNSAALIGPSGDVLGIYRKTHLFPTERLTGSSDTPRTASCAASLPNPGVVSSATNPATSSRNFRIEGSCRYIMWPAS